MDIRLIYTDADRVEQGYLRNFSADVDVAKDKDFEITVARDNNILRGGSWWYINNTEYGGIVDNVGVVTSDREIKYTGRNLRGILCDKIIEPPAGTDYKIVSGDAVTVINKLIEVAGLSSIYRMTGESWNVQSFQFNRYVSLYDGICALLSTQNMVLRLVIKDGYVTMSSAVPYDYTEDKDCMDIIILSVLVKASSKTVRCCTCTLIRWEISLIRRHIKAWKNAQQYMIIVRQQILMSLEQAV